MLAVVNANGPATRAKTTTMMLLFHNWYACQLTGPGTCDSHPFCRGRQRARVVCQDWEKPKVAKAHACSLLLNAPQDPRNPKDLLLLKAFIENVTAYAMSANKQEREPIADALLRPLLELGVVLYPKGMRVCCFPCLWSYALPLSRDGQLRLISSCVQQTN